MMENLRAINGTWNQTIAMLINDLDNVINNIDNGVTINNDTLSIILNQLVDLTNSIDSLDINHNYNITNYSTNVDLSNIENKLDQLINKSTNIDTTNIENKLDQLINKKLQINCSTNITNNNHNCNLRPQKPIKKYIPLPEIKPVVKTHKTPVKQECIIPTKGEDKKSISKIDSAYLMKLNNIRKKR